MKNEVIPITIDSELQSNDAIPKKRMFNPKFTTKLFVDILSSENGPLWEYELEKKRSI